MKIGPQVVYIHNQMSLDFPNSVSSWALWEEYSCSWTMTIYFSIRRLHDATP
jgi:hypothetical protein